MGIPTKSAACVEGALVIGGGIAGMRAAKALADLGHRVHLVENAPILGKGSLSEAFSLRYGCSSPG